MSLHQKESVVTVDTKKIVELQNKLNKSNHEIGTLHMKVNSEEKQISTQGKSLEQSKLQFA